MKFELLIASRLKINSVDGQKKGSPSLNIAVAGMTLAIIIMILSICIVSGFKREISNKIYSLDPHIRIYNAMPYSNKPTIDYDVILPVVKDVPSISEACLIAEKPAILKTSNDFKGIIYKGVDSNYDWTYLKSCIVEGRVPNLNDSANVSEIILSKTISKQLNLKTGDRVHTYFIDEKVKVRNSMIVGIYSTDLEDFDNNMILGNIRQLQSVNKWESSTGDYIGVNCNDVSKINDIAADIQSQLTERASTETTPTFYNVTSTTSNNAAYFTWLNLLDTNVIVIIVIMLLVSSFTLIAGLLMIVLERINMIGILKTLGTNNTSIRKIFIYLTNKLIIKSLILGNLLSIGIAVLQDKFHILKLNAEAYYISYVPIELDWSVLLLLNIGIIVVSYITLLVPSHIISTIKPYKSINFE